ncbi:cadherin-like beta sandwich domain-containing protein [uncultured Clostridium sp.]|uniref:cadherin-like beta sandwich domain-containing protein n=1 Tax=uncultured Clostridium sp. TaxID=59620 RepID=UPI0025F1F26C|nr:cadherin-like beta sandwich domain-containing protein [uncultured Clostridium sp.]
MNKNLKKIIAITLSLNAIAVIEPAKDISIFTETAHAAKYDDPLLSELKISGYDIDFDKEKYSYKIKVDKNVDQITVRAKPEDSANIVTVNGDEAKEDDKYKVDVDVKQGENTITIRVKDENHDLKTVYELEVTRGSSDEGEDLDEDDIYLDNITLSQGTIDFSSKITEYTVYVDDRVRYLDIKAKPMDSDEDYVEINGEEAEEDDDYEQTVTLKDGKNKITIRVENSEISKKYILNVYKGVEPPKKDTSDEDEVKDDEKNDSSQSENNNDSAQYKNKWVSTQGIWIYYDDNGNLLKNQWLDDSNTGKSYFLNENGVMETGWLNYNGKWYYLNEDGSKHTGWKFLMGVWYHMDGQGVMNTGWFRDSDGKWYYLSDNGAMLTNTTIGGYKLGSDGAWIK